MSGRRVGSRAVVVESGPDEPGRPAGAGQEENAEAPGAGGRQPSTLGHRPGLDGLRAVAVAAVMAQHAGLRTPGGSGPLVPGGFLGVDVFFVISGFLITALLLVEHERHGRVDLRAFWLRRARRLLPAVGLMVAGTSVLVAVTDLPLDPGSVRGDGLSALAYVANWRYVVTEQSYFAAFGLPSPFRHLWSLSLEEQWYVVFPPLLVAVLAAVRRRPALLLAGLAGAAAASAAWMAAVHQPGTDPSRAYYGTDTRAQALLVGAALAVVMVHFPALAARLARLGPVTALVGLLALAAMFRTIEGGGAALYQGGFLLVALTSAAVVAGVALPGARGPVARLLSLRGPVVVGQMSYGLYLWHWPVYVWLTPDRVGHDGVALAAVRVAVSAAVATVSYVVVEQPVRRHGLAGLWARAQARRAGLPAVRPAVLTGVGAALVVAIVVVSTAGGGVYGPAAGSPAALPDDVQVTTTILGPDHPLPAVPEDRDLRVMVGGDSVAWSLAFNLVAHHEVPDGLQMKLVAELGCTVTPGLAVVEGVQVEAERCRDWQGQWERTAFVTRPDVVVAMWGAWEVYDHQDGDRLLRAGTPEAAAAYQQALADSIDRTVAVSPDTRFAFLTVPCMRESSPWLGEARSPRNDPAMLAWVNGLTAEVAARYGARATVIDLGPLVCAGDEPLDEVDGVTVRDDGVHFTADYSRVVWAHLQERLRAWLAHPPTAGAG